MPTRNRRRFVGQAIAYFHRQEYTPRELIVIDDGDDPVRDLVPEGPTVRYVRAPRDSIGAKRNLGCRLANGALIAHWDDDDWMAPTRLTNQVAALLDSKADATGASELLYYDLRGGRAWRYTPQPNDRTWVAGSTLVYRRSAWVSNPFPEIDDGEDAAFVARMPAGSVLPTAPDGTYVGLLHGANAGRKDLRDVRWEARPLQEVASLFGADRAFYAALRTGSDAVRASRRPMAGTERVEPLAGERVTIAAPFMVYDGYGGIAEYLVLGMRRAGAQVDVLPITIDPTGLSPEFRSVLSSSEPTADSPALYSGPAGPELNRVRTHDLFVHTMWESDQLPTDWVRRLRATRAVIVPASFLVDVLRRGGVTSPVEVVPDGIDPGIYRHVERAERDGFTTLIVATPVARKHLTEAVAAWTLAFGDDPDARLIIKSRFGMAPSIGQDPRIEVIVASAPTRGIAGLYERADVLLALGNEGFGLPVVEGMATGLPVIALESEGQADVCREARGFVLPVRPGRWESCEHWPYGRCGMRAVPSVEHAADQLRWVSEHLDEAREMGRAASAWARRHRDVWDKGPAILEVMERHLRAPRSLRRAVSMVVPSAGTRCGIAEYGTDLVGALSAPVRLSGRWPEPRGLRLIHVQHEDGIVDDAEMLRRVSRLAAAGVPVAVTEHSVHPRRRAWERDVAALVALTGRGASALARRWPGTKVEHIPHGCHTWFPPRKRPRGRVVGAFGFMERHKGFGSLLDVLREVHGTELLLFSHDKHGRAEWWEQATQDLPVRRVADYLPAEEVARRLAAEADVLTFWYDDVPHASASGAVTVGLASGVPVLASRTSWFEDLREVIYQPDDLVEGVARLLEDSALRADLTSAAREYCHQNSWTRVARRHEALWRHLQAA